MGHYTVNGLCMLMNIFSHSDEPLKSSRLYNITCQIYKEIGEGNMNINVSDLWQTVRDFPDLFQYKDNKMEIIIKAPNSKKYYSKQYMDNAINKNVPEYILKAVLKVLPPSFESSEC